MVKDDFAQYSERVQSSKDASPREIERWFEDIFLGWVNTR